MSATVAAEGLKRFLAAELDFAILSLERLPGRSASINYKVVRADGEAPFVVKMIPLSHTKRGLERWRRNLHALAGSLAATEVFPGKDLVYDARRLLFLDYRAGRRLEPDELTDELLGDLLTDYETFARTLSRCPDPYPAFDALSHFTQSFSWHRAWTRQLAARLLWRSLAGRTEFTPSAPRRIVHGDFHLGNIAFAQGRLAAVYDVEDIRLGYPTEDFVRLFSCADEHLSPFDIRARRHLRRHFARFVARSPYSREQWLYAVDLYLVLKLSGFGFRRCSPWTFIRMHWKARTYLAFRRIVKEALHG